MDRILLASSSPRRREILRAAGFRFRVVDAPGVEEGSTGEPGALVRANARAKARAAATRLGPGRRGVVLGADTLVVVDGKVLGKPRDRPRAASMLAALAGRWHRVLTGICLIDEAGRERLEVVATRVHVLPLAKAVVEAYLASGEADDKAGAYGIQGRISPWIDRIAGCYFNVVGLSPAAVARGLAGLGREPRAFQLAAGACK